MKIKILGQFEYQSFPIVEDMIEINDNDLNQIGRTKQFDVEKQCVIPYDNSKEIAEQQKQEKIFELKENLTDTDYQAIKYAEGQISEEEYAPIKAQRQIWRDEINMLEKEAEAINGGN